MRNAYRIFWSKMVPRWSKLEDDALRQLGAVVIDGSPWTEALLADCRQHLPASRSLVNDIVHGVEKSTACGPTIAHESTSHMLGIFMQWGLTAGPDPYAVMAQIAGNDIHYKKFVSTFVKRVMSMRLDDEPMTMVYYGVNVSRHMGTAHSGVVSAILTAWEGRYQQEYNDAARGGSGMGTQDMVRRQVGLVTVQVAKALLPVLGTVSQAFGEARSRISSTVHDLERHVRDCILKAVDEAQAAAVQRSRGEAKSKRAEKRRAAKQIWTQGDVPEFAQGL